MALSSKHPHYAEYSADWTLMRDAYKGERHVKEKGTEYLPATSGQIADGMSSPEQLGYKAYQAYRARAVFPDFVSDAVEVMLGMMHTKPPVFELPAVMEPLIDKATNRGEGLEQLLRRINEEQLVAGRLGLLAEVQDGAPPGTMPYIATYVAEDIINWDDGGRDELSEQRLNLVVLDETENERQQNFEWERKEKYRVLVLGEPEENAPEGTYRVGVFREESADFSEDQLITPQLAGRTLDEVPFVFLNSKDVLPDPDDPPLIGLARLALAVYRGEADYRHSLFMQGQDTLVVIGGLAGEDGGTEVRVGANARLDLPIGGDAKYIGVESEGLTEMRQSIENDKNQAMHRAGQLVDSRSAQRESGDALRIRSGAQTATLNQIALSGAYALEQLLKVMAKWVGANPDDVKVTPNLDFVPDEFQGKTLVEIMTAKTMGAPISAASVHAWLQKKDFTDKEFEEEVAMIEEEAALELTSGGGTEEGGDPDETEDADQQENEDGPPDDDGPDGGGGAGG